jgi:hypothetical protein
MPEPFAAWLQSFEAEFQRRSGLPWLEACGELELLLDCHTGGLSPEDTAADQLDWLRLNTPTAVAAPPACPGTQPTG